MIDWEEVVSTDNSDKLKELKLWLFQENIRLETRRKELEETQDKFNSERMQLKKELDELNRRTLLERKRLKEENMFFEKKMAILQDGFRQLEQDRKNFEEKKKHDLLAEKNAFNEGNYGNSEMIAKRLFSGISNPLALRKRYKDLVKIFHPDNMFGDEELIQMINKEYYRRKEEQ